MRRPARREDDGGGSATADPTFAQRQIEGPCRALTVTIGDVGEPAPVETGGAQALTRAALAISRAGDLETRLRVITEEARRLIGSHHAVTSTTRGRGLSEAVHMFSLSEKYAKWRNYDACPNGSGIYAEIWRTNRPMRLTQAELEAHPLFRGFGKHAADHPPLRGWLAAPLVAREGANLGVIQLSDKIQGEFTETDERFLQQLAQLAAAAIETALAVEALADETRTLQTLSRTGTVAQGEFELGELIRTITDAGIGLTNATCGAFFSGLTRQNDVERAVVEWPDSKRTIVSKPFPFPGGSAVLSPSGWERGIVRLSDIRGPQPVGRRGTRAEGVPTVRSLLVAPVVSRSGELLGRFCFGHRRVAAFSERAERIVANIAEQSATAIDNARLFGALQNELVERRRAEDRLRDQAVELEAILAAVPAAILIARDPACRRIDGNRISHELLRVPLGANQSKSAQASDFAFRVFRNGRELGADELPVQTAARGDEVRDFEEELVFDDGTRRHLLGNATPLRDADNRIRGAVAAFIDITERKRGEAERERLLRQIEAERSLLETVLRHLPAAVVIAEAPSGRVVLGNDQVERLLRGRFVPVNSVAGYSRVKGMRPDGTRVRPEDWPLARSIRTGEVVVDEEIVIERGDGTLGTVSCSSAPIRDHEGNVTAGVVIFHDISEQKQTEQRIRELALHDPLTRLPNRVLFRERLALAVKRTRRSRRLVALLLLDLDRFKEVNDLLGHQTGDRLLDQVAVRLRESVRATDTVARLGGDEFAIVLDDLLEPEDATRVVHVVLAQLAAPFRLDGHELHIGGSIGVTIAPEDGDDPDVLLRQADLALYRAKERRNDFRFFSTDMAVKVRMRSQLERDLRRALENDELELYFQPEFDLTTDSLRGGEALLRWRHPARGWVPPEEFVPIAESTGLILPMGAWATKRAVRQARSWRRLSGLPLVVAVNVSIEECQRGDLAGRIEACLSDIGLEASALELEVTESLFLRDEEAAVAALTRLRSAGCCISVDDFGTGYSSLGRLRRLPVSKVKIDRSFVSGLGQDADADAIVRSVIALGHTLGLRVTAEGVETPEQLAFLRNAGCHGAQGFLLGRPMPASEFERLVRGAPRAPVEPSSTMEAVRGRPRRPPKTEGGAGDGGVLTVARCADLGRTPTVSDRGCLRRRGACAPALPGTASRGPGS